MELSGAPRAWEGNCKGFLSVSKLLQAVPSSLQKLGAPLTLLKGGGRKAISGLFKVFEGTGIKLEKNASLGND